MFRSRFIAPSMGLAVVLLFGYLFIGFLIPRSPYTHANLSAAGYNRTGIIYVGQEHPYEGFQLKNPDLAQTGDPVEDGRILFFANGCAACHGLKGQGGATGKSLHKSGAEDITEEVRDGPKTMPVFENDILSDTDIEKLVAFLESVRE